MKQAHVIVDLGFGDARKGAWVDFLSDRYNADYVIHYTGGCQQAHTVTLEDGRSHTFSQIGSGLFAGAGTILGPHMRVNPIALIHEAAALNVMGFTRLFDHLHIDQTCLVTTPYHAAASKYQAGIHQRGTTGAGVGETARYAQQFPDSALCMGDLRNITLTRSKLTALSAHYANAAQHDPFILSMTNPIEQLSDLYASIADGLHLISWQEWLTLRDSANTLIFEGAQGILIDCQHGYQPFVTSSNVTPDHALDMLVGYEGTTHILGVMRAYMCRHGAGPLPTETPDLSFLTDPHNTHTPYQGSPRYGWCDTALLRYALDLSKANSLAISHLDHLRFRQQWQIADDRADIWGTPTCSSIRNRITPYVDFIHTALETPVSFIAAGPRRQDTYDYHTP